jgi:hypothetical protein
MLQTAQAVDNINIEHCDTTKDTYAYMEWNETGRINNELFEQDNIDIVNVFLKKDVSTFNTTLKLEIVDITQNLAWSMLPITYLIAFDNLTYCLLKTPNTNQYDSDHEPIYDHPNDMLLNDSEWLIDVYIGENYKVKFEHHLYSSDYISINFKDTPNKIVEDSNIYVNSSCKHYRNLDNGIFLYSFDAYPNLDGEYDYSNLYCGKFEDPTNYYLIIMIIFPIAFLINFLLVKYMKKVYKPIITEERYVRRG